MASLLIAVSPNPTPSPQRPPLLPLALPIALPLCSASSTSPHKSPIPIDLCAKVVTRLSTYQPFLSFHRPKKMDNTPTHCITPTFPSQ